MINHDKIKKKFYFFQINVLMSSINSMANPALYLIFMPAFRRCVVKTFFPCLKNKIWPQETHNTNTTQTTTA